jgi:hypothetical protein
MKGDTIVKALEAATKKWTKQRKKEERDLRARLNRYDAMMGREPITTIKDAAFEVMEEAYMKASANGTLPANARQIMYAARPYIIANADRYIGTNFDKRFTQSLLPEYLETYPSRMANWNIAYDSRGSFTEPFTGTTVPLGTLEVRSYLGELATFRVPRLKLEIDSGMYPTNGPRNAFGAVLFVEKEGFQALFDKVKLAERYDLAIMSTKGLSVTAARELVDTLSGTYGVDIFVLHDFDKTGFSIFKTLGTSSRRYRFKHKARVINLGLRLEDVEAEGLESEEVSLGKASYISIARNLRANGATDEEISFLTTPSDDSEEPKPYDTS